jgi:hypothetical protein
MAGLDFNKKTSFTAKSYQNQDQCRFSFVKMSDFHCGTKNAHCRGKNRQWNKTAYSKREAYVFICNH